MFVTVLRFLSCSGDELESVGCPDEVKKRLEIIFHEGGGCVLLQRGDPEKLSRQSPTAASADGETTACGRVASAKFLSKHLLLDSPSSVQGFDQQVIDLAP